MPNTVKVLKLTTDEKSSLEAVLRCPTTEARKYIRAKILLLKSNSYTNEAIADKLDITVPTVRLCIQKYLAGGIENALNDCKGKGRKQEISDDDITWVINKACQKPLDYGFSAEFWYPASFTRFIQSIAVEEGHPRLEHVSEFSLRKILANAKIRPFKVTYYCERRDPDFDSKMHDVLVIYKQVSLQFDKDGNLLPFEGTPVHTLSYDEKPGIQAIGSTMPDLPPNSNTEKASSYMRDYEYIRHGTLSLLAAIDLLTGEAIPLVSDTHKSSDFVEFLTRLDAKYPKGDKIRLILDNHSAHTSQPGLTWWKVFSANSQSKCFKVYVLAARKNCRSGFINTLMRLIRFQFPTIGPIISIASTWLQRILTRLCMKLSMQRQHRKNRVLNVHLSQ